MFTIAGFLGLFVGPLGTHKLSVALHNCPLRTITEPVSGLSSQNAHMFDVALSLNVYVPDRL